MHDSSGAIGYGLPTGDLSGGTYHDFKGHMPRARARRRCGFYSLRRTASASQGSVRRFRGGADPLSPLSLLVSASSRFLDTRFLGPLALYWAEQQPHQHPPILGAGRAFPLSCRKLYLLRKRQLSDPLSCGGEDRVAERRQRRGNARLAHAAHPWRVLQHSHLYCWGLADSQRIVIRVVRLLHHSILEGYF